MKSSKLFIKTSKNQPKEAYIQSHKLLIKGSFIKQVASGIYFYLPLGLKVRNNVANIIRKHINKIDFLETYCPMLVPKEYLMQSGRYEIFGNNMLKLKDRQNQNYALGPTHEEHFSQLISKEIKSYKELPVKLYQINYKFRDEIRPRFGPIRSREFLMKDAYSYHSSEKCLKETYNSMKLTYKNIFNNLNLKTITLNADSGVMGGNESEEFMVENKIGEESIVKCENCNYKTKKENIKNFICPKCSYKVSESKIIEIGHIFNLGKKYTKSHNVKYINKKGIEELALMGCYGIGVDRIISTIIEEYHDDKGIIWPKTIAPYQIVINPINQSEDQVKIANQIYQLCLKENINVILEDRNLSISERFKDWDLIGIPIRINIGKKAVIENLLEVKYRNQEKAIFIKKENLIEKITKEYKYS